MQGERESSYLNDPSFFWIVLAISENIGLNLNITNFFNKENKYFEIQVAKWKCHHKLIWGQTIFLTINLLNS